MGGRRAAGRAKRPRPLFELSLIEAPSHKPFPQEFIDLLQGMHSARAATRAATQPVKRRKTDTAPTVDSVIIWEHAVSILRPASGRVDSLTLPNLQSALRFEMGRLATNSVTLTVHTRPTVRTDALAFDLGAVENTPAQLIEFCNAPESCLSNPNVEDACWMQCDGQVGADSKMATITLTFKLKWNISTTMRAPQLSVLQQKFRRVALAFAFPHIFSISGNEPVSCSPQAFYEAAYVPDPDDTPPMTAAVPGLVSTLYPFQRRAVKWLLRREGIEWIQDDHGNMITKKVDNDIFNAPSSFISMKIGAGQSVYISPVLGKVTNDPTAFKQLEQDFKGGILSEEMGLGKTVELMALISLHPQPPGPDYDFDFYLEEQVQTSPATLIVVPTSLKQQWLSELAKHAPGLRVRHYQGLRDSTVEDSSKVDALVEELRAHDVVVTTYNVLTTELDYVLGEPDRARRAPRKYHRPRSPLMQLRWWRVCMDEAQMIESGVSKSATLARLLPRVNAWSVTGTPVKDSVEDLRGLLLFLRYEPFASNVLAWNALVQSHQDGFKRLFKRLALRHSKRLVGHEIDLPRQRRHVMTMSFNDVEEQHYKSLFNQLVGECGLSPHGAPLRDDWDPDDAMKDMRDALDRLRKTALHPEVGKENRRALGRQHNLIGTMAEVLGVMVENCEAAVRTDQRSLFSSRLTRGQLLESSKRVEAALQVWQGVLHDNQQIISKCQESLEREIANARAAKPVKNHTGDEDGSDDESDENRTGRIGETRRRLRMAMEIQHKATFFCANAYFQMKSDQERTKPDSDEFRRLEQLETSGYEAAKTIRRRILEDSRGKALKLMKKISTRALKQTFAAIPEFQAPDFQGIGSCDAAQGLIDLARILNDQANQLDRWRKHVIKLLLKPLVDDEETESTGNEYENSTKLMEEIVVYTQILRTAVADREQVITGQVNKLVEYEVQQSLMMAEGGKGPYPEKLIELLQVREQLRSKSKTDSVRSSLFQLRSASSKLSLDADRGNQRAQTDLDIITKLVKTSQDKHGKQWKVVAEMNKELDLFTATMNARVKFYRQLQDVSDQVGPYTGRVNLVTERKLWEEEGTLTKKIAASQDKCRYLLHLRDTESADGASRMCVICRDNFMDGVLTNCGHQFCMDCNKEISQPGQGRCPVCRKALNAASLHKITFKPKEMKIHSEAGLGSSSSKSTETKAKSPAIFTEFSTEKLKEIRNIELAGPAFSTKVDNLARHLIWLRENTRGTKSIVYSQYADFLSVLGHAFTLHGIGYTSFERPNSTTEFKDDPSIEVFLLHARAHSSGLNLTNAAHVFLCEPLVNTALELQAIARVHRIGQERETTVWLYIIDGTVEKSIYNISVQRRMQHMHHQVAEITGASPKLEDEAIEAANALELEQAQLSKLMSKRSVDGEAVDKSDLWECLFGHVGHQQQAEEQASPIPAPADLVAAAAMEQGQGENLS